MDILNVEDYKIAYLADIDSDGEIAGLFNRNGLCNWTICPLCRIDDFTHVEGCSMLKIMDE